MLKEDSPTSHNIYLALAIAEKLKLKVNYNDFAEALTVALTKDDGASRLLSVSTQHVMLAPFFGTTLVDYLTDTSLCCLITR